MPYLNAADLEPEDYLVLGQATCFTRIEGSVHPIEIIEPIPSASLETLWKLTPTSYRLAYATTLAEIFLETGTIQLPPGIFAENAQLCEDFLPRSLAATRTYKAKPQAQTLIPLGATFTDFQYSTDKKRILHLDRVVKDEDNVKQHSHTHKVL